MIIAWRVITCPIGSLGASRLATGIFCWMFEWAGFLGSAAGDQSADELEAMIKGRVAEEAGHRAELSAEDRRQEPAARCLGSGGMGGDEERDAFSVPMGGGSAKGLGVFGFGVGDWNEKPDAFDVAWAEAQQRALELLGLGLAPRPSMRE